MAFDVTSVPFHVNRALQIFAFFLVAVLSFDNALFHLFSLLLLITFCISLRWIGLSQLKAAIGSVRWVHLSFAAIWAIMLVSNLMNAQSEEAWRTMSQFGFRYWLLFSVFSSLLFFRVITVKLVFTGAMVGLSLQFIPFIPNMLDLSIFNTRFQGMSHNPNTAGFVASGLLLLSLYLAFYQNLPSKLRYALAIPLAFMALIALLATGNRGGWVASIASATVFLGAMLPRHPKKIVAILLGFGVIATIVLTQFSAPAQRLALLLEGQSSARFRVWQNAWGLFLQKPFLGHGLDLREAMLASHYIYHEHNVFLSVLTAMGLAGFLAYTAVLGSIGHLAFKYRNYFALLVIAMMLMVGMFAYDFYRSQIFLAHFVILASIAVHRKTVGPN